MLTGRVRTKGLLLLVLLAIVAVAFNIYGTSITVQHSDISLCDVPHRSDWMIPESHSGVSVKIQVNKTQPPKLFHCGGYALNRNFQPTLLSLLPEYEWVDLSYSPGTLEEKPIESHPWDLFVSNWQLNECTDNKIHRWLQLFFQGKVLFLSPEDITFLTPPLPRPHYFELGPGPPRPNRHVFYFLQAAFWAQMGPDDKTTIIEPKLKPKNTGKHFLIYAHSHCVGIRQSAFRRIANLDLDIAYYGGRCNGGMKNTTKARKYPNVVSLKNWEDNRHVYRDFRFCLTMEHVSNPGYVTEKILVAFWAGCIPIYYGSREIFDIFDSKAFIYYDVDEPQPALDQIKYFETNRSAYDEMLRRPILAEGAVERYFSLSDGFDGGQLKTKIRDFLGLDRYKFLDY